MSAGVLSKPFEGTTLPMGHKKYINIFDTHKSSC